MKSKTLLPAITAAAFISAATLAPASASQSSTDHGHGQGPAQAMKGSGSGAMMGAGKPMGMGSNMGAMGKNMMKSPMMQGPMMKNMRKKMMSRMFFAREKPYSNDDVKRIIGGRLAMHGFSGLRAGTIRDDGDNALSDIVSPKGELLFRVKFNRKTGMATIVE